MSLGHKCKNSFLQFSRDPVNGLTTFFHTRVDMLVIIITIIGTTIIAIIGSSITITDSNLQKYRPYNSTNL